MQNNIQLSRSFLNSPPLGGDSEEEEEDPVLDLTVRIENPATVDCFALDKADNVVFASRKGLFLFTLRSPYAPYKVSPLNSKWDISDVEWNPHPSHSSLIASTNNQETLVWDVSGTHQPRSVTNISQRVLLSTSTSKTVNSLNWSPFIPSVIATCGANAVELWDIRTPAEPVTSFNIPATATHVKWNKFSEHIFATAHEGQVRVWDNRKPKTALVHIMPAHMSEIYGIDWSFHKENELLTNGKDRTVKIWNVMKPKQAIYTSICSGPVWRARFAPHDEGFAALTLSHANDSSISYYEMSASGPTPVQQYNGFPERIKDFQFRVGPNDDLKFVTLSKNQTLRIFKLDPGKKIFNIPASYEDSELQYPVTMLEASKNEENDIQHGANTQLAAEFDNVHKNMPADVHVEMYLLERKCVVFIQHGDSKVEMKFTFPSHYPNSVQPILDFLPGTNLSIAERRLAMQDLLAMGEFYVSKDQPCLGPCIDCLSTSLQSIDNDESSMRTNWTGGTKKIDIDLGGSGNSRTNSFDKRRKSSPSNQDLYHNSLYGDGEITNKATSHSPRGNLLIDHFEKRLSSGSSNSITKEGKEGKASTQTTTALKYTTYENDRFTPFPRTCSAVFGGNDKLIMFNCLPSNPEAGPMSGVSCPRDLHSFYDYLKHGNSIPLPVIAGRDSSNSLNKRRQTQKSGTYTILDDEPVDDIFSVQSYFIVPNPKMETRGKRKPIVRVPLDTKLSVFDVSSVVGLNKDLASSYLLLGNPWEICEKNAQICNDFDRQQLAELWTLLALATDQRIASSSTWKHHPFAASLFHKCIEHYVSVGDVQTVTMIACVQALGFSSKSFGQFINSKHYSKYISFIKKYMEILHRWDLLIPRNEIAQFVENTTTLQSLKLGFHCSECQASLAFPKEKCRKCPLTKRFECSLCRIAVRGKVSACLLCGHGGHPEHMKHWFESSILCPAGCGCYCSFK